MIAAARRLEAVALARYAVNKSVIRLRRDQLASLPPMLAETLPHLPGLGWELGGGVQQQGMSAAGADGG